MIHFVNSQHWQCKRHTAALPSKSSTLTDVLCIAATAHAALGFLCYAPIFLNVFFRGPDLILNK